MSVETTYICYAKRSPIGRLGGIFSGVAAPSLAAPIVKDALAQTGLDSHQVDELIMGCVLPAGQGQAPARQVAIHGGLGPKVCATTINRVCGSGLKAVMLGHQAIMAGDSHVVFAGGMESMTEAPHMLLGSRAGFKFGSVELKDHCQWDGLWDPYNQKSMGTFGDLCAREKSFTRADQDQFAIRSYEKAKAAWESGHFNHEVVPIEVAGRKGSVVYQKDEQPYAVDLAKISTLKPAFDKEGTITAGNASPLNDGAAICVLASESAVKRLKLTPIAKIVAQASHAQDPAWFTTAPIECIRKVLTKAQWSLDSLDQIEINEAFAVVPLAAIRELGLNLARVNPFGGAVALGHPIGASGARIIATLLNGLRANKQKRGLATLCIGGGEASAVVIEMCG
jgi:acetyl-CoA C-acetyltransferase